MSYIFLNDKMLKKEDGHLHVSDLSIHRGYGIFDFFKIKGGQNPWMEHYLDRFYNSLSYAGIPFAYSRSELREKVEQLAEKNGHLDGYIKMICTGGYSSDGYSPPAQSNFLMFTFPLKNFGKNDLKKGFNLIMNEFLRANPKVKSTNYFNSVKNYPRMKEYDAVDVLYHYNGKLSECSRCNVFVIKDKIISTPDTGMLEGITRLRVLEQSNKGYDIRVQPVGVHELFTADELFVTSSTKGVMPVVNIEGRPVGSGKIGPIASSLAHELETF